MNRQMSVALSLCISLLYVAFMFETSIAAQTRPRSGKRPTIQNPPIAAAQQAAPPNDNEEQIRLNKEIETLCAALQEAMFEANGTYSPTPFDSLTPDPNFIATCKADGTIAWTATRNGANPSDTQYTILVRLKVTDLTLGSLTSNHGVVVFSANDLKIDVSGPTTVGGARHNVGPKVREWWVDLRNENELATTFKQNIRKLVENLAARVKVA